MSLSNENWKLFIVTTNVMDEFDNTYVEALQSVRSVGRVLQLSTIKTVSLSSPT